ncbi:amino acid ABC transporter substrate-binding protein [Desulfuromonas versatilis]|uniref:Amino acid ABC transporter substrate-binding protein n=1 Tax=Desulfuromonas versatilis TaxID=2802975 RepID=A0ABN6E397_9BACT|nr:transporter substrate-binding domain-containing protein [Desulfuromonas versatilis]BCR06793.1 amino acid ABC transporter substrate-binding protein [Desulfuromonas versatilis]
MRSFSRILLCLTLLVALTLPAAAADLRQELVKQSTLEQVLQRGVLRVGMSTFVPWAMKDKSGELIGFEIDVASRLAQDLGVKVEFVPTKWSGIIPALLTGKFDVIIGGMGILPERNLKVNFTIPYDHSGMSLVASKKLAAGFSALADFNREDVVVVARIGTTGVKAVQKYLPRATLRQFDDEAQAVQELLNGRAHAFVTSKPKPTFLALQHPDRLFLPLPDTFTREPIGFALRKGDVDTLNFFDNWIRVVEDEGWLQERRDYWFGSQQWESRVK